jgi:hypothetical protein
MTDVHPPSRSARLTRACAFAAALLFAASPTPAHAQFGKLKQVVKKEITGKDSETQKPASTSERFTTEPLTLDRIDQFFAAVEPWMQKTEAYSAALEAGKAYEVKAANVKSCQQQVMSNPANMKPGADMTEFQRANERAQRHQTRSSEARQRGDTLTARILWDSIGIEQVNGYRTLYPALKQCGDMPVQPSTPPRPRFEVTPDGQRAFSRNQLGYMRERITAYRHLKANRQTDAIRRQFNADEIAALERRQGQVDRFGAAMDLTSTQWMAWQDLPAW